MKSSSKNWRPPPRALVTRFHIPTRDLSGVEQRKMFGCPCVFMNGNMFAALPPKGKKTKRKNK